MSFSSNVKEELTNQKLKSELARRAQLAAITHTAGALQLGRGLGVEYVTETHAVGKHIAALSTALYPVEAAIALRKQEHRRTSLTAVNLIGEGCESLLTDAGVMERTDTGIEFVQNMPHALLANDETKRAFLRGAFLGAGSCSNPKRTYHLEIVCRSMTFASQLTDLMNEYDCNAKYMLRKGKYVIYLKEGDRIASFLALIGASMATLAFEDIRAEKELRNYINRTSNCTTANIGKTVNAAADQIEAIRTIERMGAMKKLSPALQEAAELRLNYPDASLKEIAELAGVGKSGIYHRFQKLIDYAQHLQAGTN